MKSSRRFILLLALAVTCPGAELRAQLVETIMDYDSTGWSYLHPVNGLSNGYNPASVDADFNSTWLDPTGVYNGGAVYNGPGFVAGAQAPFEYNGVNGIDHNTELLPIPINGTRGAAYFLKTIDGGAVGYTNLKLTMLSDDGAYVYLNGVLIAVDNVDQGAADTWDRLALSAGSESSFDEIPLIGSPVLNPGPNLLAISLHNSSFSSSDLGFDVKLEGSPTPVTVVSKNSMGWSYLHSVNGGTNGVDPAVADGDFNSTWFDPAGTYNGGAVYDGAAFITGGQAPFEYGGVDGIVHNTLLTPRPNSGTRGAAYFTREIDGGVDGYYNLEIDILADDGAFIYLNGKLIGTDVVGPEDPDTWGFVTGVGANENSFDPVTMIGITVLPPGPNLLAVSLHNTVLTSGDLGFDLEVRAAAGPIPPLPPFTLTRGPYLQQGTPSEVTIRWCTSEFGTSTVRHGAAPGALGTTTSVPGERRDHVVTLIGLTPNARVFYKIESERTFDSALVSAGDDADHYTDMAPVAGTVQPVRIWAIGDSGTGGDGSGRAESVYNAYRTFTGNGSTHTDVWLMLGDNAYNAGTNSEYQSAVFDTYPEMLRNTMLWPTIGNHDASNTSTYLDIFTLPKAAEAGGLPSGTELYYSFDYADIHFVCLDSQTSGNYNAALGSGMYLWLENDLMATTRNWIIAYYHHGPYTKGSHDSDVEAHHIQTRTKATEILEDHGVDLVLYGHSHAYERSMLIDGHYGLSGTFDTGTMAVDTGNGSEVGGVNVAGIFLPGAGDGSYNKPLATPNEGAVYITAGSSGKLSNWDNGSSALVNPLPHPVMIVNLRVLGSMVLDVTSNQMHAQFLDSAGAIRDDFTIRKDTNVLTIAATDSMAEEFGANTTAEFEVTRTGSTGAPLTANYSVGGSASNPGDYTPSLAGTVMLPMGQASETVTITRVLDSLAEGTEDAVLNLTPGSGYLLGVSESATATIEDKPADAWRFTIFGAGNPPGSGWHDDFDKDSITTLFEYGLGGDPTIPDVSLLPTMDADSGFLKLIYERDNSLEDLIYRVKTGPGMAGWTTSGVTDNVSGPPNPTGVETREASIPLGPDSGFLRLELELQP